MSRSSNAPRYGALVEKHIRDEYSLDIPEGGRTSWHDAETMTEEPVSIKGTMHRRADGSPGRFRVFREPHHELARADGWYAFGVYRPRGRGVELLRTEMKRARAMRFSWGPSGHHRGQQAKLRIEDVIG